MSSQITRSQAIETNAAAALTTRRFILNNYVIQTTFICILDSISMRDMVPTLIYYCDHCQVIHLNSCLHVFYHTQNSQNYLITSLLLLEDMPDVIYRNMNIVMLSIKPSGDFYLFYGFPHGRILTLFMRYLSTLNIAKSHTQH